MLTCVVVKICQALLYSIRILCALIALYIIEISFNTSLACILAYLKGLAILILALSLITAVVL